MIRRLVRACTAPVMLADWLLGRVFGEPTEVDARSLREASERAEELRRQVDRSHR